ncbi:MAG: Ppx/GppA family phosphatase [Deltaproteobacteria bacterium]|nr:MAG: Ppx/GppA family phosphatase [Deltaproteobacteria bacterium]
MKLAAVDIGSNSVHMIIARIDGDGNIEIIDRLKEMVRLGEETLATGYLSEAAQERGLGALRRFRALADGHRVEEIIAVATSATREARNGAQFIARVADECDIHARIIDGVEEGRYIYLGAREVHDFGQHRALIIDIGGGSVELIIADRRREYLIRSLKLGVRRLRDLFLSGDETPDADEVEALQSHIRTRMDYSLRSIRKRQHDTLLATSGTAGALARLTRELAPWNEAPRPGFVPREHFRAAVEQLLRMDAHERASLSSIDERRRDSIVHGAVLLRTLVELFGNDGFTIVDGALREGLLVDYIENNRPGLRLADEIPDPRRRSVLLLARRLYPYQGHSRHVAQLALRLFDETASLHRRSLIEREWLDFAALLHNVGTAINRSAHNKHSLYIIQNADLAAFSPRERSIVANIARYHRRSAPKSRHPEYMELDPPDRERVKELSAILRIANALDRGRRGNVTSLRCTIDDQRVRIAVSAHTDPSLEMHTASEQARHFEDVFGRRVLLEVVDPQRPKAP